MPQKPARPPIQVQRASRRSGDQFWYYSGGQRVAMSPTLALQAAKRGAIRIKTIGDRR